MKRWRWRLIGAAVACLMLAQPSAGAAAWQVDGAQSLVRFALRGPWLMPVEGRFAHIEGRVDSVAAEAGYDVTIRIAAGSVLMRREGYEEWAKSPEFFDVQQYPWIEFSATDVPPSLLQDGGPLHGELQLCGHRRPIVLTLQAATCATPGRGCPVQAAGQIDRSDFGMQAKRVLIGERVRLDFEFLLKPEASDAEQQ